MRALPGPTVTANKVKLIFKSARYSVIDYTFFDSGLLIIASKAGFNPKPAMLLLSPGGDTLAQGRLRIFPEKLIRNCAGTPYLLTEDSLYRISRDEGRLICTRAYPIWMADVIASCQLMKNGTFYYKAGNPQSCSVSFTRRSMTDTTLREFTRLTDSIAAGVVKYDMGRIRHWLITNPDADIDVRLDLNDWDMITEAAYKAATRNGFNRHNFRDILASTDLYQLDDSMLLITDYLHKRLCYFSATGAIIATAPMQRGWSDYNNNTLLRDEVTGRFYIHFSKNGGSQQMRELRLREGIADGQAFTFEQQFAERVSVHDGLVYFLQHDPNGGAVRQLFVQRW